MPVCYELLVFAKLRGVDPFFYLDFAPVGLLAFMDLQKILEASVFIVASQREKPAKSRTDTVNPASSLVV